MTSLSAEANAHGDAVAGLSGPNRHEQGHLHLGRSGRIAADEEVRAQLCTRCPHTVGVTPRELPTAPPSTSAEVWRPGALARDGAIAVVGGLVLCSLALWFWRQAVLIDFDTSMQDYYFSKARRYGFVGLLALAPGVAGICVRNRQPQVARRLTVFGRTVVLATALLYAVWSLALILFDI